MGLFLVSTQQGERWEPGATEQTFRTIVGLRRSCMALESRFLLRELVISRLVSWFREVAEVGVKIPDWGRDASDEGEDLDERITDAYGRSCPCGLIGVLEISEA